VGNNLLKAGQGTEAIACYKNAIKLNPNWAEAYQNLAAALQRAGALEEATICYRQAIELKAKQTQTNLTLRTPEDTLAAASGVFFNGNGSGKSDDVLSVKRPISAADYLQQARVCGDRQQWQQARDLCQKALSLQPKNAELCREFGDILAQQQQWEAAITAYCRAVELDQKLPGMETRLAHAFRERANLDLTAAASFYNLAIQSNASEIKTDRHFLEIQPHHPDIYLKLGETLVKQNRPDEAISIYQTAMQRFPENPEIYLHLGKAMAAKNDRVGAMAAYRRAIAIDPNHYWSHHHLGDILAEEGKLLEAIASYHRAIETNPSPSFWHYHNLGAVQGNHGEWEAAIVSYGKAIELNPNYSWSHKNLGDILAAQGKIDEATVCYRRAIKLKPRIL